MSVGGVQVMSRYRSSACFDVLVFPKNATQVSLGRRFADPERPRRFRKAEPGHQAVQQPLFTIGQAIKLRKCRIRQRRRRGRVLDEDRPRWRRNVRRSGTGLLPAKVAHERRIPSLRRPQAQSSSPDDHSARARLRSCQTRPAAAFANHGRSQPGDRRQAEAPCRT